MAYYLVRARPRADRLVELAECLESDAFLGLRPFGQSLTSSLRDARVQDDGLAVWEEEDYCVPPLAQERAAVLDTYFDEIAVERVAKGEGWKRIATLPPLFDSLRAR